MTSATLLQALVAMLVAGGGLAIALKLIGSSPKPDHGNRKAPQVGAVIASATVPAAAAGGLRRAPTI